jgi:hypothetical protein
MAITIFLAISHPPSGYAHESLNPYKFPSGDFKVTLHWKVAHRSLHAYHRPLQKKVRPIGRETVIDTFSRRRRKDGKNASNGRSFLFSFDLNNQD